MKNTILKYVLKLNGKDIFFEYEKLKKLEYDPTEKNLAFQEKKLKKLLLYSWKNVPYYQTILSDSGVVKSGKVYLENFCKVPVLTKEIIRKEGSNLYSKEKRKGVYENSSGGSTGEPVKFLQDSEYWTKSMAGAWLQSSFVTDYPCKHIKLWGSERDILQGGYGITGNLKNWLYSRKFLNSFRMSEKDMANFVGQINSYKPQVIEAYAQSIYELSKFVIENKLEVYSPAGIISSAGMLYPEMKRVIEKAFKCRVINRYGSREVGSIACSCEKSDRLHLNVFQNYVEILDQKQKEVGGGRMGSVHVTTLTNFAMPLIRYDIGDLAVRSKIVKCSCGRGMPFLESVRGREVNIFKTKKEELIDGEYFTHLFYHKEWVKQFQVVQKKHNFVMINIVVKEKAVNKDIRNIENAICKVIPKCRIEWNFVNKIEPLRSGKYIYTVSEVK